MQFWSGADGKVFVGDRSPSPSDYEAGGVLTDGRKNSPCNTAKIIGEHGIGLLISMPLETALIDAQENHAYIAQVHYAPEKWTFSSVTREVFLSKEGLFDEYIQFISEGGEFVFFDSAYTGEEIREETLSFELNGGHKVMSSLICRDSEDVLLTLIVIR